MEQKISEDVRLGKNVYIAPFVNLYGCEIGDDSKIGAFVEMQRGSKVGKRCKIGSHSFLCDGVEVDDDVFIGHGVMTINDKHPRASVDGKLETPEDWAARKQSIHIRRGASIGSNATIFGGIEIGEGAIVGAGAVVTKSVSAGTTVVGNPARVLEK